MLPIPPEKIGISQSRQSVPPIAAELNLDIQHVVLQDISISDGSIFVHALQQELTQLLSQSATSVNYQSYQVESLQSEATVAPGSLSTPHDIHQLVKPIAEAIYAALSTQLQ